jgi:pantoate--beta-alanine ligase
METFHQIKPLKAFLRGKSKTGPTIGLVPTMGALHKGHLSLIDASKSLGCLTVCSIFVNPAQFNNTDDLHRYPHTPDADVKLLQQGGCDVLFSPAVEEIYAAKTQTSFDFNQLDKIMEGKYRAGHFSGVALVVSKLFHIIEPAHAFFGQKDWQQFTIIHQLVKDLNFELQLHAMPTVREADGLAMSSRNQRLTSSQRKKAVIFYQILQRAAAKLLDGQTMDTIEKDCKKIMEEDTHIKLDYLQLADRANLTLLKKVETPNQSVLCIAGFVGEVRLIDNILL